MTTSQSADAASFETENLIAITEQILSSEWGEAVRLTAAGVLREKYRNRVLRLSVQSGPSHAPTSVIVKRSGPGDAAFNPDEDVWESAPWRFRNEWAGTQFLNSLKADPPLCAGLLGADPAQGVLVLQDLGSPHSLAGEMQEGDLTTLESALFTYARSLGRLHARTIGKEAEWTSLRRASGGSQTAREPEGTRWLREEWKALHSFCEAAGVSVPVEIEAEAERIKTDFDAPGPFLAFSPGDTCPDNHRLPEPGSEQAYLQFFDFEFAGFRHALIDAAYLIMPFPTCWCVNRLPQTTIETLVNTYRKELVKGCPAASTTDFDRLLVYACAYWLTCTLAWGGQKVFEEDQKWGISTVRQRHLLRLDNFLWATSRWSAGTLPAFVELATQLRDALASRWSDMEPMPLYPAFRAGAAVVR